MNQFPGVSTVSGGATAVAGNAAEEAATTANPVIVGGVVRTATSPTTLVAGDAARVTLSSAASVVNLPYAVPEATWSYASAGLVATTAVTARAAVASYRNYVTGIQLSSASGSTAGLVEIRDGTGGTVLWRGVTPAGSTVDVALEPPLRQAAVNTLIEVAPVGWLTGTFYISMQGFTAP
jgi:hypothetical protein